MKRKMLAAAQAILFFILGSQCASAQSDTGKIEIGGQFTALRFRGLETFDPTRIVVPRQFDKTNAGFGGRFTYNLSNSIGVEAEFNAFQPRVWLWRGD